MIVLLAAYAQAAGPPIHLAAERAALFGCRLDRQNGESFITNFVDPKACATWRFRADAGIYEVRIHFSAPMGDKGFGLRVNGEASGGMFKGTPEGVFNSTSGGRVELVQGENTLAMERGWGYFSVSGVDLVRTRVSAALTKPPDKLVDPAATPAARQLYSRLLQTYGERCLSGQYGLDDAKAILAVTGRAPAILGADFMDYSPSRIERGTKPVGVTEQVIAAAREGDVVTMSWHWNAPSHLKDTVLKDAAGHETDARWYKGFYTNATDFDLAQTLDHPESSDYRLLIRDIDAISAELKKLTEANVPVLWRPLHEAEGGWFWWGAKGPGPFKRLWRLMYERMTKVNGLHNLIWVYSSGTNPAWYPGDAWVDVVGVDAYPSSQDDPLSTVWDQLEGQYGGRKIIALTEFGGVPNIARMRRFGAKWAYFVSWVGTTHPPRTPEDRLRSIYRSAFVDNRHTE